MLITSESSLPSAIEVLMVWSRRSEWVCMFLMARMLSRAWHRKWWLDFSQSLTWIVVDFNGLDVEFHADLWALMEPSWILVDFNVLWRILVVLEGIYKNVLDYTTNDMICGCVLTWGMPPTLAIYTIWNLMISQWMEWGSLFSDKSVSSIKRLCDGVMVMIWCIYSNCPLWI